MFLTSKKIVTLFILAALFAPSFVKAEIIRSIVFPVDGENNFTDTWGAARSGGRTHIGTDIIAAKLTPLVSAVDGRITFMPFSEPDWGYAIYIKDDEGYSYRYLHVNNDTPGTDDGNGGAEHAYAPGLSRGSNVSAGQLIGWVGDSGNAEGVGAHLHFEIWSPEGEAFNSYPSLIAAGRNIPAVQGYYFSRDLELGDEGQDVLELQKYLNLYGYTVATSGPGSAGNETQYFGPATQAALIKFQETNKISPAVGYFGEITRTLINNGSSAAGAKTRPLESGWLVKNNKYVEVFYVDSNYQLHWIINEEAAERHFGSTWNQDIKEFDDLGVFNLKFGNNLE